MKKIIQILALMFLSGIAQADIYSDAEDIMNEKESVFQNYFPSHQQNIFAPPWLYRYYPETNNYQGINLEDGLHYVMGSDFSPDTPKSLEDDGWHVKIIKPDGTAIPLKSLEDGTAISKLVMNESLRVKGQIPESYSQYWGQHVELQMKERIDPYQWTTIKHLKSDEFGAFDIPFVVSQKMLRPHYYRIALMDIPEGQSEEVTNLLGSENVSTTTTDLPTSDTLTATGDFEFAIELINETKDDLNITIPTTGSVTGQWDQEGQVTTNGVVAGQVSTASIRINAGTKMRFIYSNPMPNQAVTWIAERADGCLGKCDQYVVNWDHKPSNKYTACVDQIPNFQSNQTHYVRITPRTFSSSMDLFIWGDNDPLCTAGLDNGWGNFWDNHRDLKIIAEVTAVVVGVTVLAVTCPECFGIMGDVLVEEGSVEAAELDRIAVASDIAISNEAEGAVGGMIVDGAAFGEEGTVQLYWNRGELYAIDEAGAYSDPVPIDNELYNELVYGN